MAKAKKQESTDTKAGATKKASGTKAEAKPKAPSKGAANKPAHTGSPGVPQIDTSLAASAAASMVLNRSGSSGATPSAPTEPGAENAGDKRETSTFKQLKQGLTKSGSQGLGGILGGVQGGKKSGPTFNGPNQVRRNQTFGADVSRNNVPRRTGG